MARELPNLRVMTISPRSIMGVWAGLSVLVSIRTQHGKRCPVSMREGTVATSVTVIMVGMIDYAGYWKTRVMHWSIQDCIETAEDLIKSTLNRNRFCGTKHNPVVLQYLRLYIIMMGDFRYISRQAQIIVLEYINILDNLTNSNNQMQIYLIISWFEIVKHDMISYDLNPRHLLQIVLFLSSWCKVPPAL